MTELGLQIPHIPPVRSLDGLDMVSFDTGKHVLEPLFLAAGQPWDGSHFFLAKRQPAWLKFDSKGAYREVFNVHGRPREMTNHDLR
jgi:hypothetical protein